MFLTTVDWLVLATILLIPVVIGLRLYRRAGTNLGQFFLSGRDLPWWLAGTSMVATTFAADTPLAVTGLVASNGVAGNWLWWNAGLGSMLTVFFFARLWRRAGIVTDVEFAELRYTGRPAAMLRGLRALYLGLPINCLIIGWVNLAMSKVLSVTLGWNPVVAVSVGLVATGIYAALAGLRGVVVTDFVQFGLAMVGSVALAFFALSAPAVGGVEGLLAGLPPDNLSPGAERRLYRFGGPNAGAAPHRLHRLSRGPVVGELVSRTGARRWRLRGAANDVVARRAAVVPGDLVVHDSPLLSPTVAVGPRGPRLTAPLSRSRRP